MAVGLRARAGALAPLSLDAVLPRPDGRLDRLGRAVQGAVQRALGPRLDRRLMDGLHGTWLGHPLHPILTDVPIGAWTAAVAFDAADAAGADCSRAARAASLVGLAGGALSAITGLADWSAVGEADRPRRVGMVHAAANTVAMALMAASLGARGATARALRLAGMTATMAGGYLGGELVFGERIGVDHSRDRSAPEQFTPALALDDLDEGAPHRAEVDGLAVVIVRRGDRIDALADACSHLGGPLSEGEVDGGAITCPWHGSTFRLEDGSPCHGPATHDQPVLETRVRAGMVEVRRCGS